ncbi:MAG: hypothetical protein ABL872_01435 [Lacibacter sp.]
MKRFILPLLLLSISVTFYSVSYSQSKFADGFKEGYKKGYCQGKQSCLAPLPPPVPLVNVGESYDSYMDGYNRGFKIGLDAQSKNTSGSSEREGYKTSSAEPIDYVNKQGDSKVATLVAKNRYAIFEKIMERATEYYKDSDYRNCIKACQDAMNITKLRSRGCYTLMASSYEKLGNKQKAKQYYKKANKL